MAGPSTDVRYSDGNVGRVPIELWACAEHVDVYSWSRVGDGPWEPSWMHPEPCPLGQRDGMMRPRVGPVTYPCPHRTHENAPHAGVGVRGVLVWQLLGCPRR